MSEPGNNERAGWARVGVKAFAKRTGIGDDDIATQVSDLLADLMHLADLEQLDWEDIVRRADGHYQAEVAEFGRATRSPRAWSPRIRKHRTEE
jgi:hypothetical protein